MYSWRKVLLSLKRKKERTWRFLAYYEGGFIYAAAKEGVSNREPDLLDKCGIVVLTHDAGAFVLVIAS